MILPSTSLAKSAFLLIACATTILSGCSSGSSNKDKNDASSATASAQSAPNCGPGFEVDVPNSPSLSADNQFLAQYQYELIDAYLYKEKVVTGPGGSSSFKKLTRFLPAPSFGIFDPTVSISPVCQQETGEAISFSSLNIFPMQFFFSGSEENIESVASYYMENDNSHEHLYEDVDVTTPSVGDVHNLEHLIIPVNPAPSASHYKIYRTDHDTVEIRSIKTVSSSAPSISDTESMRLIYKKGPSHASDRNAEQAFVTEARINEFSQAISSNYDLPDVRRFIARFARLANPAQAFDRYLNTARFMTNHHFTSSDRESFSEFMVIHGTDQLLTRFMEAYDRIHGSSADSAMMLQSAANEVGIQFHFKEPVESQDITVDAYEK